MYEKLDISDFDIIGLITLNDVNGIEKYVTPVREDGQITTYLSRSKEYYNVKSMTELALEREELKTKLTRELSRKNFVILENMLNCSGKVYFRKFEEYILSGKDEKYKIQLQQAKDCLIEDTKNILVLLQNKGIIELDPRNILPTGDENSAKRAIEMDNKAMLYIFTKALKMKKGPQELEVLTPGYGSIYIGPFFHSMYGYDFTNALKSKYISESKGPTDVPITELMSSDRIFSGDKTILLLDDNIGTGATMLEFNEELRKLGIKDIISGAIQYNWRNYFRVTVGEKKDIDRFEIEKFDIVTPFNYAGHKLYKHAIDLLHSSGAEYIEYLNSKKYRLKECSDLEGAILRGLICSDRTGLDLADGLKIPDSIEKAEINLLEQYQSGPFEVKNPISRKIIKTIIADVIDIGVPEINYECNEK